MLRMVAEYFLCMCKTCIYAHICTPIHFVKFYTFLTLKIYFLCNELFFDILYYEMKIYKMNVTLSHCPNMNFFKIKIFTSDLTYKLRKPEIHNDFYCLTLSSKKFYFYSSIYSPSYSKKSPLLKIIVSINKPICGSVKLNIMVKF